MQGINQEIQHFQQEMQRSRNQLQSAVSLKAHQVEVPAQLLASAPGSSTLITFSNAELARLEARIQVGWVGLLVSRLWWNVRKGR